MTTIRIVAFGDSITMDKRVEEGERWLSVLGRMLSEEYPNIEFYMVNAGEGGNSDREKMARYERDVLAYAPDILILQFGGNNSGYNAPERFVSTQESKEYLQRIKDTIPERTTIVALTFPHVLWRKHQFYIAEPERFIAFFKAEGGHEAAKNRYREVLKAFAAENNYPVVDLYGAMKELDDVECLQVSDGVHLNAAGDRFLAGLVFETLDRVLARDHKSAMRSDVDK